jgi:valyl-tRNA synthetase
MSLIVGNAAGNDPIISEDKIRGYRNFTTKIWNASRFVLMNEETGVKPKFTAKDRKNLNHMELTKKKVGNLIEKLDFNHAAEIAYHYFWHTFADKIIEESKPRLKSSDENDAAAARETLINILLGSLKMLHPFMPFVTETIYQELPLKVRQKEFLMVETWR